MIMRNGKRKAGVALILALALTVGLGSVPAFAADGGASPNAAVKGEQSVKTGGTEAKLPDLTQLKAAMDDTAAYVYQTVKNPEVGSIGGEWAVLGLARSGFDVPKTYYQDYYKTVENYVKGLKGNLSDKKYTEYSRLIVALTSIGKDPHNVAGYDLIKPLGDYDKTIWQGLNGPIWALIALDSGKYDMPKNSDAKTQATRDLYIKRILECQLSDGGFSLFGGTDAAGPNEKSDPDITGMALQALAKYQDRADVKKATEEALACMSKQQDSNGGFSSWGTTNLESCVQMVVALDELKIPQNDSRFVKNGKTMLDNMMTFYKKGAGFVHTLQGEGSNQMATEQGFYGLVSAVRAQDNKSSLYRMTDPLKIDGSSNGASAGNGTTANGNGTAAGNGSAAVTGLPGKNKDVTAKPVVSPGKTFSDIQSSKFKSSIEDLASRGVINGKTDTAFEPDKTMTRAEFATIVVNALGLTPKATDTFTDVAKGKWYAPYVGTASAYGIVSGSSPNTFQPEGTINRQEAAVMVTKAAGLCGMDTTMTDAQARDVIAQFDDYVSSASWARTSLAFCYEKNILDQNDMLIRPTDPIKRGEIADMIDRLLGKAELR